jgi:DNA repair exonuclease SbcCD ATPase subunit
MTEKIINTDGSRNWQANILLDNVKRLEQENKSLYEEKNCLHKIIDRLLENAGYSKDIASAEDFEDVYEDMQRKVNELAELEQENKELKKQIESQKGLITVGGKQQYEMTMAYDKLKTALEEIRDYLYTLTTVDSDFVNTETYLRINDKIEEVLNS